jgi:hypothetical protein
VEKGESNVLSLNMAEALGTVPCRDLNIITRTHYHDLNPEPYHTRTAQEDFADVGSDGGSFNGSPIGPFKLGKADDPVIVNEELAQQFGVSAIGTTVCREFGTYVVFYGVITAFRKLKGGGEELYEVAYIDGDVEDIMDGEE